LFWINKVLNDNEQTLRQDIYSFSRLFNLVIHYELGNHELLDYIIKSTFRYLNKKEKDYTVENLILKHMRKLGRIGLDENRFEQFKKMNDDLILLFQDKKEQVVLDYFDFDAWLNAKMKGTDFAKEVAAKSLT